MRLHLLEGAKMSATTFATDAVTEGRASGHEVTADGPVPVEPLVKRAYGPAGTSVVSTVTDLLRFAALPLDDSPLAALRAVRADVSICGWLDSWRTPRRRRPRRGGNPRPSAACPTGRYPTGQRARPHARGGDEVTEEEWSRVFAAFGPHLPDEEREARTP
jgi:hypothetical protein